MKSTGDAQVQFEPYEVKYLKCFKKTPAYAIVDESVQGIITYPSSQCTYDQTWQEKLYNNQDKTVDLTGVVPDVVRNIPTINYLHTSNHLPPEYTTTFRAKYDGIFYVETAGAYTFYITSDDGSRISIDGKEVKSMWSNGGLRTSSASINLEVGWHTAFVEFYQATSGYGLKVMYAGPGFAKKQIPVYQTYNCTSLQVDISQEKVVKFKIQA